MGRRKEFAESWWAEKWIDILESFGWSNRLSRGRTYARRGMVQSIEISSGTVEAYVSGTQPSPYYISINIEPLSDEEWDDVSGKMASQAVFAAKLLSGQMPENIEDAFNEVGLSLFPMDEMDIDTDCSCPDWANPCKHIAAVYYLLGQEFDEDPFLIFRLRGRTKEQIIHILRKKRAAVEREASMGEKVEDTSFSGDEFQEPPLEECIESFWKVGKPLKDFSVSIESPEVRGSVLKRLKKPGFRVNNKVFQAMLWEYYETISKEALKKAYEED